MQLENQIKLLSTVSQLRYNMAMDIIEILKVEEGFREMPYFDTEGILSVAYGRNLISNPWTIFESKQWSKATTEEKKEIGTKDVISKVNNIILKLPRRIPLFGKLDHARGDFLILMSYQLGIDGVLMFRNTLSLMFQGKYDEAANEMLKSKWAQQTPKRARRMARFLMSGNSDSYFATVN